jgi:hypothetical protein
MSSCLILYDFGLSPPLSFPQLSLAIPPRTWESLHKRRPSVIHYTCLMQGCFRSKNYELVPGQFIHGDPSAAERCVEPTPYWPNTQWIGLLGKIYTGNPWLFTSKYRVFHVNFPANQFYEIRGFSSCIEGKLLLTIQCGMIDGLEHCLFCRCRQIGKGKKNHKSVVHSDKGHVTSDIINAIWSYRKL